MSSKHIKTPWRHDDEFRAINIFDAENRIIATLKCGFGDAVVSDDGKESCQGLSHIGVKANAELLCKAVNSHQSLIDALEDTVLALTSAGQYSNWKDTLNKAEKALKLAKGEE